MQELESFGLIPGFPGILFYSFIFLEVGRGLGKLVFRLAEYGCGFLSGFTAGLGEFMSGLDESMIFNETLISWVWDLFKGP